MNKMSTRTHRKTLRRSGRTSGSASCGRIGPLARGCAISRGCSGAPVAASSARRTGWNCRCMPAACFIPMRRESVRRKNQSCKTASRAGASALRRLAAPIAPSSPPSHPLPPPSPGARPCRFALRSLRSRRAIAAIRCRRNRRTFSADMSAKAKARSALSIMASATSRCAAAPARTPAPCTQLCEGGMSGSRLTPDEIHTAQLLRREGKTLGRSRGGLGAAARRSATRARVSGASSSMMCRPSPFPIMCWSNASRGSRASRAISRRRLRAIRCRGALRSTGNLRASRPCDRNSFA